MDKMQPNSLSHVPTAFVHDVLIKLAPRILAGADCLTVEESGTCDFDAPFPPFLRCSLSPPPHLPQGYAIPPTHLLMLTFDGSARNSATGAEPPLRLMVPIHEAVWTLRCHTVARLVSSSPSSPSSIPDEPADTFDLPVISFPGPLPLAAFSTFSVLHTYLHTATLPSHLPSPDAGPDDDSSFDSDSDSDSESDSGSDLEDEDEDIDFASDFASADDEEEDPLLLLQQQRQYEGLYSMCRAFGIDDSDPIYEWMAAAAAAAAERWRGAANEQAALFARGSKGGSVDVDASVDEEDMSSSWSHLPTPPPG